MKREMVENDEEWWRMMKNDEEWIMKLLYSVFILQKERSHMTDMDVREYECDICRLLRIVYWSCECYLWSFISCCYVLVNGWFLVSPASRQLSRRGCLHHRKFQNCQLVVTDCDGQYGFRSQHHPFLWWVDWVRLCWSRCHDVRCFRGLVSCESVMTYFVVWDSLDVHYSLKHLKPIL